MGVLTKIRQMPDNKKKIFSLATAAAVTLVIAVVWFSSNTSSADTKVAGEEVNKLSSVSPMQVIKDEFSKAFSSYNSMKADLDNITASSTVPIEVINVSTTSTSTELQIATSTASTTISTSSKK